MKKSMLPLDLEFPWNQVLRVFTSGVGMVNRVRDWYQYWYEHGYQISQQSVMT